MDLANIGKFIKEQRKSKGLTQIELAEKLCISEKTISKWECGNGFPDTTLILPLCKELGISANELLSGKKLSDNEYQQQAENNLLSLQEINQRNTKLLLSIEIILGIFITIFYLSTIFVASFVNMSVWLRITIIMIGIVIFLIGIHFCLLIEKDAGFYECSHCHNKYVPTYKQVLFALHINRTRYMKCPKCNKKSWQKKVVNK